MHICICMPGLFWFRLWLGAKPVLAYCLSDLRDQILMKSYSKYNHFQTIKSFENIACKMSAILSLPQCVKGIASLFGFFI